jgi:phage/plasmid-associated DNA primase
LKNDIRYRQAFLKILVDIWFKKDLKKKIDTPPAILENSRKYIDDCNYVKRFLDEGYDYSEYDEKINPNAKIASSSLFNNFKVFCITNGIPNRVDDKKFKPLVEAEGYIWRSMRTGRYFTNIVKKPEIEEENE